MESTEEVDLYIRAIKEQFADKITYLTTEYEDKIANLRVELTMVHRECNNLRHQIESLSEGRNESVSEEAISEATSLPD